MSVKMSNIFKIAPEIRPFKSILNVFFEHFKPKQRSLYRYINKLDFLPSRYGGKHNVTVLKGLGSGTEVMTSALEVLDAADAPLSYEILQLGEEEKDPNAFANMLYSIKRNKVALRASVEVENDSISSHNVLLKKYLDLFVFFLECKTYPGLHNKFGEINIVIVHQNTEGEYLMLEHEPTPKCVESLKIVTKYNSLRIAEFAFSYALQNNRKLVTVVHNANVHILSEGLFIEAARMVALKYPTIKLKLVETGLAAFQITKDPNKFDVILTTNLNGSILTNCVCAMAGGPGLSSGINYGEDQIAVFEPAGRIQVTGDERENVNPVAMIMAGVNLLQHLGHHRPANIIRSSVYRTLVYDKIRTQDIGGKASTKVITEAIIKNIKRHMVQRRSDSLYRKNKEEWKKYCQLLQNPSSSSSSSMVTKPSSKS